MQMQVRFTNWLGYLGDIIIYSRDTYQQSDGGCFERLGDHIPIISEFDIPAMFMYLHLMLYNKPWLS